MLRGWSRGLGLGALAVCLTACSNEGPLWQLDEIQSLDDLAEQFPAAAPLLAQAKPLEGAVLRDALHIRHVPEEPPLDPRWRSLARELVLDVSPEDASSFEVSVPGTSYRVGVQRSAPVSPRTAPLKRALRVHALGAAAEAFFFATDGGIEELLLVRDATEPIEYQLDLPPTWTMRRAKGRAPIVEMLDGLGAVRLRVVADRAWDATEQRITPTLEVDEASFRLGLPESSLPPVLVDPEWQEGGTLTESHRSGTATLLPNGKVLIAGGWDDEFVPRASAEIFDPATGDNSPTESMSHPRSRHTATLLRNGQVLLAGGIGPQQPRLASAELYDPGLEEFVPAGELGEARANHTATLLHDGRVLIAGGNYHSRTADDFEYRAVGTAELFDPERQSFSPTSTSLKVPRGGHTATRLPTGQVLITGGSVEDPDPDRPGGEHTDAAELFQPDSESFKTIDPLNQPKTRHAALLLSTSGPVLVSGEGTDGAEQYDLATEEFSPLPPVGISDDGARAASLLPDGTALITTSNGYAVFDPADGGFDAFYVDESLAPGFDADGPSQVLLPQGRVLRLGDAHRLYLWSPEEPRMASPIHMLQPRYYFSAAPLPTGEVLLVGGSTASTVAGACAAIFDPETHSVRPTKTCPVPARIFSEATVLRDGQVLITGGALVSDTDYDDKRWPVTATTELYHPDTEQFEEVKPMQTARVGQMQVLLPDGRVLVTGGLSDWEQSPLNSVEVFDPANGTFERAGKMAVARSDHRATLLVTGKVLITGGPASGETAEIYDPNAPLDERSSLLGETMAQPRAYHDAVPLPDGTVLLAGGFSFGPSHIYEVFEPERQQFSILANSPEDRVVPRATLLPSGQVLIAGGCTDGDCNEILNTTELLDPALGERAVTQSVPMAEPRFALGSTLLPDGRVLLAGGGNANPPLTFASTADVWREAPVEDAFRPVVDPIRTTNPTGLPSVTAGTTVTLRGRGFTGVSEGSSGQSPSPTDHPVVMWMPLNGVPTTGTTVEWTDEELRWKVPPTSYPGPGYLFVAVNGVRSKWRLVTVLPADNGTPCEYGSQCESGHCAHGVCCDEACDSPCYSCLAQHKATGPDGEAGPDGECGPVAAGLDPLDHCEEHPEKDCSLTGTCDGAGQCAIYPEGASCGPERICRAGYCSEGCVSNLDCHDDRVCLADGICAEGFTDSEPGCAPACAVGTRRRGAGELLALLLLGGLYRLRRRRVGV